MYHARRAFSNHENKGLPLPLAGEGTGEGGTFWFPPHLNPLPGRGRGGIFWVIF